MGLRRRPASLVTLLALLLVALQLRHLSLVFYASNEASGDLGLQEAQSRSEQRIEAFSLASNTEGGGGGGSSGSGGGDDSAAGLEAVAAIKGSQIKEVFGEGTSLADAAEAAGNAMALPGTHSFDRRVKRFIVTRQNYYDSTSGDTQDESSQAAKVLGNVEFLPEEDMTDHYASCAVVGNSGSLLAAPFGSAIDEHDAVFRFNDGPTEGFETYVGNKTTFRVINNNWTRQWQKKRPHKINDHTEGTLVLIGKNSLRSSRSLYEKRGIRSLILSPEFGVAARKAYKESYSVLEALKVIQVSGRNTAPSGIEGLFLAMAFCSRIRLYGFGVLPKSLSNSVHIQHDLQQLAEDHKPTQAASTDSSGESENFGHGIAGLPYHYHDTVQGVEAAHSFGYQSMFLRLLELLGHVEICVANVLGAQDPLPAGCVR